MTDAAHPGATRRVRLAQAAATAIRRTPDVEPAAGARWATAGPDGTIPGVLAVESVGAVDLQLHVAVRWPPAPLESLAATLRTAVSGAAEADLRPALGTVDVHVHDLLDPEEPA